MITHSFLFCFSPPVAILLKDDYFVRGAGLPGRFKAEKVEFHWGQSNGSAGSEHSVNGRRFPVEVSTDYIRAGQLTATAHYEFELSQTHTVCT